MEIELLTISNVSILFLYMYTWLESQIVIIRKPNRKAHNKNVVS